MLTIFFSAKRAVVVGILFLFTAGGLVHAGTIGPLTYELNGDTVTITDCDTSADGILTIPSMIEEKPVVAIGSQAFNNCRFLTSINLPESLTSISSRSFYLCISLTNITIPAGVTSIGDGPFRNCTKLLSIFVEEGSLRYTSIDGVLFNMDQTEIVAYPAGRAGPYSVPDGITSIGVSAFSTCKLLTNITIPTSVTSLDEAAFTSCESLINVSLPNSITSIEAWAFQYCLSLTSITLPDGITSIGEGTFYHCTSLPIINLPASVTSIDNRAFEFCSSLTNITIPAGVTSIGDTAFAICTGLVSIFVEEGSLRYTSIDGVLFNMDQTEIVAYPAGRAGPYSVPDGITSIGVSAFYSCNLLTSITLPDSVTSIEAWAFRTCSSLTNITIPAGVTSIGDRAFQLCSSLTHITIPTSVANVGFYTFYGCNELVSVTFLGNSPASVGYRAFDTRSDSLTIYYLNGSSGFTSPTWQGYPASEVDESIYPAATWLLVHGLAHFTDLDQDLNGDGVSLLTAYALNLDPSLNLAGSLPRAVLSPDTMSMTYYAASPGITYTVETSEDLEAWTTTGITVSGLDLDNQLTATVDLSAQHRFFRLKVEK